MSHFAERHGLILVVAISEALAAIGFGARGTGLGAAVIISAVLGLVIAASFWLAYFDFFSAGVSDSSLTAAESSVSPWHATHTPICTCR